MKTSLRCAIYTRKSSEEGLDQEFNSLDAQRESCEAYVLSQAGEGWTALKTLYDDGGFSGGNIERPALKRLLADIAAGKIDIVVVYKVDRLTRSLSDFARIVEAFDAHQVSFVSVTQAFNTTSSMGRLTLNVLLSFAQFEREVTGERIRDKIAASKKKGLWMGGTVPLGYEASGRTLVVNEAEAEQVRHIFARYLELRSVHHLKRELEAQGFRSKPRVRKDGEVIPGAVIGRGPLFHLLGNRLYRGEIVHKGECHPGLHPAIIDETTFEAAQAIMAENRRIHAQPSKRRRASPLTGLIFDEAGEPMSPTIAYGKGKKRYRYYVSAALQRGDASAQPGAIRRLPAEPLEAFLATTLRRVGRSPGATPQEVFGWLEKISVRRDAVALALKLSALRQPGDDAAEVLHRIAGELEDGERAWQDGKAIMVSLPVRLVFRGGGNRLITPNGAARQDTPRPDRALIAGLRKAHAILQTAQSSPLQPAGAISAPGIVNPYERNLMRLAFLAPDIQEAILTGRQPDHLTLTALRSSDIPLSWARQPR